MSKEQEFEDKLGELQQDMVAITLEYIEKKADYIYIYASCESDMYYFNFFYKLNNKYALKHKVNSFNNNSTYDVSIPRQEKAVEIGLFNMKKICELNYQFDREIPTEVKLIYSVKNNSLSGEYNYNLKFSNSETLTPRDIFLEWFEEVKKENGHDLG